MAGLANLIYGIFLSDFRKKEGFTQEKLAAQCYISRGTLLNFESGRSYPRRLYRESFAQALDSPILEYFPQYDIEQFSERLKVRFQAEKEASGFLKQTDLKILDDVFDLYKKACKDENHTLMIVLDEYLHTVIMNAHPDEKLKQIVTRYRQDYMEIFKIWIPLLDLKIVRKLEKVHFKIFESILSRNEHRITQSLDYHLENSLNDVQTVINHLENRRYS